MVQISFCPWWQDMIRVPYLDTLLVNLDCLYLLLLDIEFLLFLLHTLLMLHTRLSLVVPTHFYLSFEQILGIPKIIINYSNQADNLLFIIKILVYLFFKCETITSSRCGTYIFFVSKYGLTAPTP